MIPFEVREKSEISKRYPHIQYKCLQCGSTSEESMLMVGEMLFCDSDCLLRYEETFPALFIESEE